MKAIVQTEYGGPDRLRVSEVDRPDPAPGEVVVEVKATSINAADWHLMTGSPYFVRLFMGLRAPKRSIPCTDLAGVVVEVGGDVDQFVIGDDVCGWVDGGACAEYIAAPADRLVLKPENASFEEASTLGVAAFTALQGIRDKLMVGPGDRVLINGASGGVGTFAVQVAKALGSEVTAVCSSRNVEQAEHLGADHIVNYESEDVAERSSSDGGPPFDAIFDLPANRSLWECRSLLADDGQYLMVGGSKNPWVGPIPRAIAMSALALFGRRKMRTFVANENLEDLKTLAAWVESGKLQPAIERTYQLDEAADAFRYQAEFHSRAKLVVKPGGN